MRVIRLLAACLSTVALTRAWAATLVKVKPDGSGTVEQATLVNMGAVKAMMTGNQPGRSAKGPINEADLKRMAERMGKGVRWSPRNRPSRARSRASRPSSPSTTSTRCK